MAAEGGLKKPLLELAGRTVLAHACAAFDAAASIKEVILVGAADDLSALQTALEGHPAAGKVRAWVVGGDEVDATAPQLPFVLELEAGGSAARQGEGRHQDLPFAAAAAHALAPDGVAQRVWPGRSFIR